MTQTTTKLPRRVDCTHKGCTECAAQVVDGKLYFRARHNGEKHQVIIDVALLLTLLTEQESRCKGLPDSAIVTA